MISSSNPYYTIIILLNIYISSLVLLLSLYSIKYLYLVILSIITYIALYTTLVISSLEASNLTIKSKAIDIYTLLSVSLVFSSLYIVYRFALLLLHKSQFIIIS